MLYAVFLHDYLFLTDPFDLNHNLGAGVSRKSKQNYPIPHIFVFSALNSSSSKCMVDYVSLVLSVFYYTVTNFIMKAFINGRKLFGTPFYPQPGTEAVSHIKTAPEYHQPSLHTSFHLRVSVSLSGLLL